MCRPPVAVVRSVPGDHLVPVRMFGAFCFHESATTESYTLSLHDALPISISPIEIGHRVCTTCLLHHITMKLGRKIHWDPRSEEHTSELQSRRDLVCRLLLEKKKDQR